MLAQGPNIHYDDRMRLTWLIIIIPLLAATSKTPAVIATVNGQSLYESDLKPFLQPQISRKDALDRLVSFELAAQQALKEGLDKQAQPATEIKRILYKAFLENRLQKEKTAITPTQSELQKAYRQMPLIRARHLAISAEGSQQTQKAKATIRSIQQALSKGEPFQKLVLKYSQDPFAELGGGDLDYRGKHNFPAPLYTEVIKLKQGAVSKPLLNQGAYHFFQLMEIKSFEQIFPAYRAFLTDYIAQKKEQAFLAKALNSLQQHAKIELAE